MNEQLYPPILSRARNIQEQGDNAALELPGVPQLSYTWTLKTDPFDTTCQLGGLWIAVSVRVVVQIVLIMSVSFLE